MLNALLLVVLAASVTVDKRAEAVAEQVNKEAPRWIDDQTRIEAATYYDRILSFHLTLLKYEAKRMSTPQKKRFAEFERLGLEDIVCEQEALADLLTRGVTLRYKLYGVDTGLLAEIDITQNSCALWWSHQHDKHT